MPAKIAELEPLARRTSRRLAEHLAEKGRGDIVTDFAQHLTIGVLSEILGVSVEHRVTFVDWAVRLLRQGPTDPRERAAAAAEMFDFLSKLLDDRQGSQGSDLLSYLATAELKGTRLSRRHQLGAAFVVLVAGADTTWSALSAALWYLGHTPEDRGRIASDSTLLPTAVEELLRFFSPVTVARIAREDVDVQGCSIRAGERVLLPTAAANRDPTVFPGPNRVDLTRRRNRHVAFGTGVHRCLGASLARMELAVAIEEWLAAMPDYHVTGDATRWTGGAVRGPESVPFQVGTPEP
ncbi:MAG: hypothetical protein ABS81_00905 [Pseudonocardia sp. SCN 72-86]|nr:MAG: hypothetical protein ABS81_00905 [Pseudonocardia sp. SCN 72-86]